MKFHRDVLLPEQHIVLAGAAALSRKWDAYLAGGAAAALQLGHRRSVDFDWFTRRTLAPEELLADIRGLKLKMTAIVQRAVKRDYVDLQVLFDRGKVTLPSVLSTMHHKFPGLDPDAALRALTYFKDVEDQPMPQMLIKLSWQDVKRGLEKTRARLLERGPSL